MAFEFKIRTERMASCGHQANAFMGNPATDVDETLPLYCSKCHFVADHDSNLVCRDCGQHFAG